ncbi:MAG TPA: adenylate/guanylate cyclase domain-containing protein, partial [Kofleriaceae bacterium]|nr:adenylate/guanylate cyclase domain-containing protein [Kofleriaceae bacterium]
MSRGRNVPLVTAIVASVFAVVLVAVHVWVKPLAGLDAFEQMLIDARFAVRGPRAPATDKIVIVGLDDKTRARYPEVFQTRAGWARLVTALSAYHPKVIALDLFFSAPEVLLPDPLAHRVKMLAEAPPEDGSPELVQVVRDVAEELRGDEKLAAAITASHRVFLGAFFHGGRATSAPAPAGLELARHGEAADSGGGGERRPMHAAYVDFTIPAIGAGAVGAGALNNFRDSDGTVRRMPLALEYGGALYMPLGLAVALAGAGKPGDTRYVAGDDHMLAMGERLPVGKAASLSLDVLGRHQLPRVSAADVLAGTAPAAALSDKLVFVGFTYAAYDKIETPLDSIADGIELHATLAENVLTGHLLRLAGPAWAVIATALLCGIVIAAQLRRVRRRSWLPPVIALGAIVLYVIAAQVVFAHGLIVQVAAPCVLSLIVLGGATVGGLATEGREKAHLRAVFSQYVSRTVVDRIVEDPGRMKLGGERKELTVLFSDIRSFSAFAEGMGPETLASFLGEYLTPMTELVLDSGGTVDKYIGDAVMAFWAAPVDMPDHAARACEVALRMHEALVSLNEKWEREGKPAIAIGIGINTGAMAVGNMGSAARFEYTVLGDQVNLGARLEALTKEYGVGILVGEGTAKAAGSGFVFREVDVVRVKGRAGAAPVFELVGRAGTETDGRFREALDAYRRRAFDDAQRQFAALEGDPVAEAMAKRCAHLAAEPPPADWDGV